MRGEPIRPQPKPVRGAAKLGRIRRKFSADDREDAQKVIVRKRDGHCRLPHFSREEREFCRRTQTEVAHLTHKGAGGDPQTIRSRADLMIRVCRHQGPGSFHSGDLKVAFLSTERANGPLALHQRTGTRRYIEVARETSPGIWKPVR